MVRLMRPLGDLGRHVFPIIFGWKVSINSIVIILEMIVHFQESTLSLWMNIMGTSKSDIQIHLSYEKSSRRPGEVGKDRDLYVSRCVLHDTPCWTPKISGESAYMAATRGATPEQSATFLHSLLHRKVIVTLHLRSFHFMCEFPSCGRYSRMILSSLASTRCFILRVWCQSNGDGM